MLNSLDTSPWLGLPNPLLAGLVPCWGPELILWSWEAPGWWGKLERAPVVGRDLRRTGGDGAAWVEPRR